MMEFTIVYIYVWDSWPMAVSDGIDHCVYMFQIVDPLQWVMELTIVYICFR